jgi:hypothetical protein
MSPKLTKYKTSGFRLNYENHSGIFSTELMSMRERIYSFTGLRGSKRVSQYDSAYKHFRMQIIFTVINQC